MFDEIMNKEKIVSKWIFSFHIYVRSMKDIKCKRVDSKAGYKLEMTSAAKSRPILTRPSPEITLQILFIDQK